MHGIGSTRAIVECKYRSSGSVPNQEVINTIAVFESLRSRDNVDHCIIIANRPFSHQSRLAAEKHPKTHLLTLDQLEDNLFDLRETFSHFVLMYEERPIFDNYIPLSSAGRLPFASKSRKLKDVERSILQWLKRDAGGFLTIMADFGAGKTTILERVKYHVCRGYLHGDLRLRPLYLPLKDFQYDERLDTYVARVLRQEYQRFIPLERFWSIAGEGGFLFLLDGFDEIAGGGSSRRRSELFISLYRLISSASPAILTCRPTYFVSDREIGRLIEALNRSEAGDSPDFTPICPRGAPEDDLITFSDQHLYHLYVEDKTLPTLPRVATGLVEIDVLTSEQIDSFLIKFDDDFKTACGCGWEEVRGALMDIYDLSDLMTRPIILSMIKDTFIFDVTGRRVTRAENSRLVRGSTSPKRSL